MTTRSKLGLAFAVVFFLVNLGGAIYAIGVGEGMHAALHVALLVPGVWLLRRFAPRRAAVGAASPLLADGLPDRLTNLEQSIDAVAIEVERIGEGQRVMTTLLVEDDAIRAPGQGTAQPSEVKPNRPS
jgi:hypothetical protein